MTRSRGWWPALLAGLLVAAGCARQEAPGPKTVKVSVTEEGFEPSRIEATKGEMLTLVVTRQTDDTCAKEIVFNRGEIHRDLPLHQPVTVQFVPAAAGEYRFSCAMGMYGGIIVAR